MEHLWFFNNKMPTLVTQELIFTELIMQIFAERLYLPRLSHLISFGFTAEEEWVRKEFSFN